MNAWIEWKSDMGWFARISHCFWSQTRSVVFTNHDDQLPLCILINGYYASDQNKWYTLCLSRILDEWNISFTVKSHKWAKPEVPTASGFE